MLPKKPRSKPEELTPELLEPWEEYCPDNTIGVLTDQQCKLAGEVICNCKVAILRDGRYALLRGVHWVYVVPATRKTTAERKRILWKPK